MGSKVLWAVDANGQQAHTEPVCTVHVCAPAIFTPEQVADALNRYMARGAPTPAMIAAAQRVIDECAQGSSGHGAPSLGAIEALRAALTAQTEQPQ